MKGLPGRLLLELVAICRRLLLVVMTSAIGYGAVPYGPLPPKAASNSGAMITSQALAPRPEAQAGTLHAEVGHVIGDQRTAPLTAEQHVLQIFWERQSASGGGFATTIHDFPRPEEICAYQLLRAINFLKKSGWLERRRWPISKHVTAFFYNLTAPAIAKLMTQSVVELLPRPMNRAKSLPDHADEVWKDQTPLRPPIAAFEKVRPLPLSAYLDKSQTGVWRGDTRFILLSMPTTIPRQIVQIQRGNLMNDRTATLARLENDEVHYNFDAGGWLSSAGTSIYLDRDLVSHFESLRRWIDAFLMESCLVFRSLQHRKEVENVLAELTLHLTGYPVAVLDLASHRINPQLLESFWTNGDVSVTRSAWSHVPMATRQELAIAIPPLVDAASQERLKGMVKIVAQEALAAVWLGYYDQRPSELFLGKIYSRLGHLAIRAPARRQFARFIAETAERAPHRTLAESV